MGRLGSRYRRSRRGSVATGPRSGGSDGPVGYAPPTGLLIQRYGKRVHISRLRRATVVRSCNLNSIKEGRFLVARYVSALVNVRVVAVKHMEVTLASAKRRASAVMKVFMAGLLLG